MSIATIPTDVMDDMQAVADALAARKPVDPEVAQRVQARSKKAQDELLKQYGVREIAVDLIRQTREECELVTADQRLVNAFQGQFPVVPLSSL